MKAHDVERNLPRDQRQAMLVDWARLVFGDVEATSIPQRGLFMRSTQEIL